MTYFNRFIVGISGASGAAIGLRVLEILRSGSDIEIHLVLSRGAERTFDLELGTHAKERAIALAHVCHAIDDLAAGIASGSFGVDGMVIAPCSMRTLSAVAYGLSDNLLTRAADVMLKERRRLVLVAREAPLHEGHIKAMLCATRLGAVIMPPVPAFYTRPGTVDDIVTQIAARALDLAGVPIEAALRRWGGPGVGSWSHPLGDG